MDNKNHNMLIAVLFAFLLVIPAVYVGADTVSAQQERTVSLESPTDSFVVGQEINVSGTAQNVNSVSMYVRNGSEYQLVTIAKDTEVHVDTSEAFLETDVTLSTPSGQIFTRPGTYELGIIATIDAQANNGQPRQTLTESEFTRGVTDSSTVTIEPQTLEGEVTAYQNQVAAADSAVDVRGSAPGQESVVVAFVSSNGTVTSSEQPIFDDGVLDEDRLFVNFDVFNPGEKIYVRIIAPGVDGMVGSNESGYIEINDLPDRIEDWARDAQTGEQILQQINSSTIDSPGSDDLLVTDSFEYTTDSTTISAVYPLGDTADGVETIPRGEKIVVQGETNRHPYYTNLTVELSDGDTEVAVPPSGSTTTSADETHRSFAIGTANWETDGQWSVTLNTTQVDPGSYTVTVDSGVRTDQEQITIVSDQREQSPTQTTDPEARVLQITEKGDSSKLTQDDVTAVITRFERGDSVNDLTVTQDDVTATITLFER